MLLVRGFSDMVVDCESAMIAMQRATTLLEIESDSVSSTSPKFVRTRETGKITSVVQSAWETGEQ